MKKILVALIIATFSLSSVAQKGSKVLIVYDVVGNVTNVLKKQPITKRQQLSLKDQICISENGYIKLLDKEEQKLIILKNKCKGRLSTLIARQENAESSLTKQYFAHILKSLTRKDLDTVYDSGHTTTGYRNDADSILCDIDSLQTIVDSQNNIVTTLTTDSIRR